MFVIKVFVVAILLCVAEGYLNLPEGSSCEWLNATGTCTDVRRCISFAFDKKENRDPPICTFNGKEPIICCTDCYILDVENRIQDDLDKPMYKSDKIYKEKCLQYQYFLPYTCKTHVSYHYNRVWNDTRKCYDIQYSALAPIGGEDALRGDFPHMALLGYGPDYDSAQWLCGGTLISDRYILTAGHCASSTQLGNVTFVALGMLKRSDPPHYWKRYKVKRFIPHPEYLPPLKYNDIALIETETRVNLTQGVRPACLTHKPEFKSDNIAYATGWGALGHNKEKADVMQKVILQKFTPEECMAQYPAHRLQPEGINHTTQICYGDHEVARDTCQGDSGGPLQKRDPDGGYCVYAVIGVTSTGRQCGKLGAAGIYTRVYHYVPWIESIVWP